MTEADDLDVACDEAPFAPPFADDVGLAGGQHAPALGIRRRQVAPIRARASRRVIVEGQVLADQRNGVAGRDDIVGAAVHGQQRHAQCTRRCRCARCERNLLDILVRPLLHDRERLRHGRRRPAGESRMHGDRRDKAGKMHAEHRRQCAAGRHAGDEDASAIDAIAASDAADLRRDDGRLALSIHRALVEPVPASPRIRRVLLPRQQYDETRPVGKLGDARPLRNLLGGLLAAVAQHEQRHASPGRASPGYVDKIIAARPDERRGADEAVHRELRPGLEAARRRLAPEQASNPCLGA